MIDPVCIMHGRKMSEHDCLYCALCYRDLTIEECHRLEDGVTLEDVCEDCAAWEQAVLEQLKKDHQKD